jgi:hypothetical protein
VTAEPHPWWLFFFLRMAAEIKVTIKPIGNGSVKVIAALMSGLSYEVSTTTR